MGFEIQPQFFLFLAVMIGIPGYEFYTIKSSGGKTTECLKKAGFIFAFNLVSITVLFYALNSLTIFRSEQAVAVWSMAIVAAVNIFRFIGRKK